jgi:hypothetical protein
MPQIYDMGPAGFTSPPKEGVLGIFFALKNLTISVGFEPANLGTRGQHASSRPPKPLIIAVSQPQWLDDRAAMLRYTNIALVCLESCLFSYQQTFLSLYPY